ncbi:LysR substrate-binding domain-containing protein [Ideonella livida]|uniref:LysR family transcriptional regulator n=1 Tax=Ideonella livida TaxID=2707176 RepID=A0A7C9TKI5_9BURK|nr:LysR substrate-binding domain-containing protein [Ideonella livida]NDY90346.1 LysR family transcriptional regulator [Ideonella livida]
MKLDQLQAVTAIVEQGSLRAAARRLGLPQPALTRSVRALERELGVELFLRQTTGMVLTEAGERFHRRASVIVHEARRAQEELALDAQQAKGSVSVALSIAAHVGMLPQALGPFRQRYPQVQLQITEGLLPDVEAGLRDGRIDFYLGAAPAQPPAGGLLMRHLADNRRAVMCRRGHPLAGATGLAELAGAEWATTAVDYNAEADLTRLFTQHGLPVPRVMLRARSAMTLIVALAHTDLLAMLPVQWGNYPVTRDALQVIPVAEALPAPPLVMIRRPDLPLTPAAECLADVLCRYLPAGG